MGKYGKLQFFRCKYNKCMKQQMESAQTTNQEKKNEMEMHGSSEPTWGGYMEPLASRAANRVWSMFSQQENPSLLTPENKKEMEEALSPVSQETP